MFKLDIDLKWSGGLSRGVKFVMVPTKLKIVKQTKSVAPTTEAFVECKYVKESFREKHARSGDNFFIKSSRFLPQN